MKLSKFKNYIEKNSDSLRISITMAVFLVCTAMALGKGIHSGVQPDADEETYIAEIDSETDDTDDSGLRFRRPKSLLKDISGDDEEGQFVPGPETLNMAYCYAEDADTSDAINSYAGIVYQALMTENADLFASFYDLTDVSPYSMAVSTGKDAHNVLGSYNPEDSAHVPGDPATWIISSFKNVNVDFYDGDGSRISGYYAAQEIMSLASVYMYYHDNYDPGDFLDYCRNLFKNAVTYDIAISDVYYDDGCLNVSAEDEWLEALAEESELYGLKEEDRYSETGTAPSPDEGSSAYVIDADEPYLEYDLSADGGNEEAYTQGYYESSDTGASYGADEDSSEDSHVSDSSGYAGTDTEGAASDGGTDSTDSGTDYAIVSYDSVYSDLNMETAQSEQYDISETPAAGEETAGYAVVSDSFLLFSEDPYISSVPGTVYTDASEEGTGETGSGTDAQESDSVTGYEADEQENTAETGQVSDAGGSQSEDPDARDDNAENASDTGYSPSDETDEAYAVYNSGTAEIPRAVFDDEGNVTYTGGTAESAVSEDEDYDDVLTSDTADEVLQDREEDEFLEWLTSMLRQANIDTDADNYCPGHIDIYVTVTIHGIDDIYGSLFDADTIGSDPSGYNDSWQGWTDEMREHARKLSGQDWFEEYGISISSIRLSSELSEEEVSYYLSLLADDTSVLRKDIVDFALRSVGRVPYYWGGKPAAAGYSGNNFFRLTEPDIRGRILKGLDCSGWINWVYWSVTGERLSGESTGTLVGCGRRIQRSELKPGDIIIRIGDDAHVCMFISFADDGDLIVVHESSGVVNNVTVTKMTANWPYYRSLAD